MRPRLNETENEVIRLEFRAILAFLGKQLTGRPLQ
jgi:hypothetical protein